MDDKGAVVAAVSAAIAAYLEDEERARLAALSPPKPPAPVSMWRVLGRWEAMRVRPLSRRTV